MTHTAPRPGTAGQALLLDNVHTDAIPPLRDAGLTVHHRAEALNDVALTRALSGVRVLGIRSGTRLTRRVLQRAEHLEAVGAFCVGTNQIDLAAADELGIAVFNAPHASTRSVVELAVANLLALSRRLTVHDRAVHAGRWHKTAEGSREVRGRTLGIVGYGNVGSQLSVVAEALGLRVLFHDLADRQPIGHATPTRTLDELLGASDIVSLHVDGRAGNAGLLGAAELGRMRPGALLVNLSRGPVVDLPALQDALASGQLAGAALDVFPDEPSGRSDAFASALQGLPNVILTPHIGGSTEESQAAIAAHVAGKLTDHLTGTTGRASRAA
ncbi:phosphoglycerate dehydrogenase [Propioniciclava soli]|uniref:phosphoglycerate dehydrogenase n=1 Tax=Propioniciclava soli TaxID=2775081 RepID=UPI001E3269CD|nr:phosphoglycerate dehydrogenase [Propioniciclava soli]